MTSHNLAGHANEDEHYETNELSRPSKAPRGAYGSGNDRHSTDPRALSGMPPGGPAFVMADGGSGGSSTQLALAMPSGSPAEQVRASKAQARETLHTLESEGFLDQPISEYLWDIEASYDENDPKLVFPKLRAAWTAEEDRLLKIGVRAYGPNTESWPRIALLVPGRTNKSCRKRWFHSLDPSLHKGPWTAEEDELLRERVARFPSQWSRVAEGIVGRTDDQCAKRWRESLDPEIDRGKWRPEEDRLLLEKFEELGTQWQKIATFFQGRPGLHCRNRWRKIQRIITQKERKSGPIAPKDLPKTLASVTESVNRRKTAQRSRAHGARSHTHSTPDLPAAAHYESSAYADCMLASASTAAASGHHPLLGFGRMDMPSAMPMPSDSLYGPTLGLYPQQLNQSQEQQEQLYQAAAHFGIAAENSSATTLALASMMAPGSHGDAMSAAFAGDGQLPQTYHIGAARATPAMLSPVIQLHAAQHSGTPDTAGALFMPSTEGPSRTTRPHGTSSAGAKRSSAALFSPTEEQRLRLRRLGRRLYGCAAAPDACEAVFADAVGLTTHIRLAHPMVASQVPSLNGGTSPGGRVHLQGADGGADDTDPQLLPPGAPSGYAIKPYRCAMPGCSHTYKNANGLEYHIFHSRKSNDHLAPGCADADGAVSDVTMDGGYTPIESDDNRLSAEAPPVAQPLLCREAGCQASFASEPELLQHETMQHMRLIRRATKPSHRAKAMAAASSIGGSPLEPPAGPGGAFWGNSTISEVLAASAASGSVAPAAMAGAIGYAPDALKLTAAPGVSNQPMFSPMLPRAGVSRHMNHPHLASLAGHPQMPFMSAPALITETGDEPKIASYFALGAANLAGPPPQQQRQMGAFAPIMLGPASQAGTAAVVPPRTLPSEHQPQANADKLQQLGMELVQSVLNPFFPADNVEQPYAHGEGGLPEVGHDVQMGEPAPRIQRSNSIDTSSLATVAAGLGPYSVGPVAAPSPLGHSPPMLPRMATALMPPQDGGPAAAGSAMPLSPWPQGLSSLGLMSVPTGNPGQHPMYEPGLGQQSQQSRIYTPQPANLAQHHGQRLAHDAQPLGSGASCPVPGCKLSYPDVDTLRSHICFDHTREEALLAGNYSSPNSPTMGGFQSTLPATHSPMPAPLPAESLGQQQQQQQVLAVAGDRSKAPHWVDQNMWSMWIAAANGQGDPMAVATATAMGVTPGVTGVPQAFIQQQTLLSAGAQRVAAHDAVAEDELLRMFEMVSNDQTPLK